MISPEEKYGVLNLPELVRNLSMEPFLIEQLTIDKGCPLCRAAEHEEFNLFAALLGDIERDVNHPLLTSDLLCNRHATFFGKVGSSDTTANLCRPWLQRLLTASPDDPLPPKQGCPVCRLLRTRQQEWLHAMEDLLEQTQHQEAYERGHGLCFPHHRAAMTDFKNAIVIELLKRAWPAQCARLIPQLDLVINQGAFKVERQVKAAPRYALEKLFGCAGLTDYLPWAEMDMPP